jgi:hypothetical protein
MRDGGDSKMPYPLFRWRLAKEMGWTLADVDSLTLRDLREYREIQRGIKIYHNQLSESDKDKD